MVRHHGALLLLGLAAQMCLTALAATPLFVDVALRGRQVSSGRPSRLATLAKKRRKRKDRVVEDAPADDALAKDDGDLLKGAAEYASPPGGFRTRPAGFDDGAAPMADALFEIPDVEELEAKRLARAAAAAPAADTTAGGTGKDGGVATEGGAGVSAEEASRIRRKDLAELRALLELDPTADMQDDTFQSEYDFTSMLLAEAGRKYFGFVEPAFLQAAHGILLSTSILCAFVEYPGNPLTEFPPEIRDFLKTGIAAALLINVALAALSVPVATEKGQPVWFWAPKTLLLGGLAFDEISRAPSLKKR
jgi:hypothetical protein